jgi:hypothetical protein
MPGCSKTFKERAWQNDTGGHACETIRHAISLASSDDSIKVAAALYKENLKIGISLKISKRPSAR